uniref:Uncharacterized protein n=1 Tax=Tanacetum cinerariifolium TaxID=118510 RepID=A0A6L2L909_TANCI|nr:hypothetical protein [Tanacetum cinerariifolium]
MPASLKVRLTMPYQIYETLGREEMKKAVSFLGLLLVPLKQVNWKPAYKGHYTKEEEATGQWCTKIIFTDPHDNIYIQGFTTKKNGPEVVKEHTMMKPNHKDPNTLDNMKQWKKYCFHKFTINVCYGMVVAEKLSPDTTPDWPIWLRKSGSDDEIFTSIVWIRAFNMNEPIYTELCHEFYSTYKFDEVFANDELQTKRIIKFRLSGRAHSLTFLEFARRLGRYQAAELDEEGFNVYFEGGLCSDEHFNPQEYWLSISREENLSLPRSHASTIKYPVLRVIHKMITYGLCQRTTGDLDTTTLRELIDSESRLIPEDPQHGVPSVGIPRPSRASIQDLYDRMGRMKIRQEAIERMEYR